jgi:hypothetical protein
MASTSTTSYMVKICGETYDIIAKRFEQEAENLPGIGAFYKHFENAVRSLTKSNILMPAPRNYVYGQSRSDIMLGHRMNGTPYPWHLGNDQHGNANQNPPPPLPEDGKQWNFLLRGIEKQDHEDHKALELLWSWIGDYRRHTLAHIYDDRDLSTRDKILQMIRRHKTCIGPNAYIMISRYKSQWHQQKNPVCTTLPMALKNLHIMQNINNCISEMDIRHTFSSYEIAFELIPTLQHDLFTPLIKEWNHKMTCNLPLHTATFQPSMEACFLVKNSLNDSDCYAHVGKTSIPTATRPSHSQSPSSTSPSKQGYAYAAISQDPPMPTTQNQLNKIIDEAIARDRNKRSGSSSSNNQPHNREYTRDRSRDRSYERQNTYKRPDPRHKTSREVERSPRRDQERPNYSMPRSPRERGDRSPSSDRSSKQVGPSKLHA